jgi:hypothetical protein
MREDGIEIYKKYASDSLCDNFISLIDKYEKKGMSSKVHVWGGKVADPWRQDFQIALDWVESPVDNELQDINIVLNTSLTEYVHKYIGLLGYCKFASFRVKLQKTLPGEGFHNWHFETGPEKSGLEHSRALTWTVFLNDLPNGEGELEFLHYGKRIQPCKGDVVIFPAYFMYMHRGNPPVTTNKYVATGWWYHDQII